MGEEKIGLGRNVSFTLHCSEGMLEHACHSGAEQEECGRSGENCPQDKLG